MADSSDTLWYQLGYTLERARKDPTGDRIRDLGRKLAAFRQGDQGARRPAKKDATGTTPAERDGDEGFNWILASVSGALVTGLLRSWPPRRRPGPVLLVRSAAAGAAAVVIQELVHTLISDRSGEGVPPLADRLLSGTARGLVYGAVAEPRLPGPPAIRGVLYGSAEYLLTPLGGLGKVLGKEAPYGRLPLLKDLLAGAAPEEEDGYLEHLVFGLALSLMAGDTDADG